MATLPSAVVSTVVTRETKKKKKRIFGAAVFGHTGRRKDVSKQKRRERK